MCGVCEKVLEQVSDTQASVHYSIEVSDEVYVPACRDCFDKALGR